MPLYRIYGARLADASDVEDVIYASCDEDVLERAIQRGILISHLERHLDAPVRPHDLLREAALLRKEGDREAAVAVLRRGLADAGVWAAAAAVRLGLYLQEAGRAEEGWGTLQDALRGRMPGSGLGPALPGELALILARMSLFLTREKRGEEAGVYRELSLLAREIDRRVRALGEGHGRDAPPEQRAQEVREAVEAAVAAPAADFETATWRAIAIAYRALSPRRAGAASAG